MGESSESRFSVACKDNLNYNQNGQKCLRQIISAKSMQVVETSSLDSTERSDFMMESNQFQVSLICV